jgi:hypothetical protein
MHVIYPSFPFFENKIISSIVVGNDFIFMVMDFHCVVKFVLRKSWEK